jgi:hypothetical protein
VKLYAVSFERYRGGAAIARRYGGQGTVTRFYVYAEADKDKPENWTIVTGYGPTPGDRKTYALNAFKLTKAIS